MRDIAERNLEVCAQCCIDVCHRIIALEGAQKPADYHEAIVRMGELGVLDSGFAGSFAPVAGFRNVLVHEYVSLNWDTVHGYICKLDDFRRFSDSVRSWLRGKAEGSGPTPPTPPP